MARYEAGVRELDLHLQGLREGLEQRGLWQEAYVVVTSDHGEALLEHGLWDHGFSVAHAELHVPLLLRWPGQILPGRRYAEPVELVDIVPTVVDLIGATRVANRFQGRSLAALLRGQRSPEPNRPVYLVRRPFTKDFVEGIRVKGSLSGVRQGKWKLVEATEPPRRELYDLETDPRERVNRLHDRPDVAARLGDVLAEWRRGQPAAGPASGLSDSVRRALQALGYVESASK